MTFTKRRETKLEHFVSNDAQENADLNDPRWDELKNLKTNEERMKYAMKAFGNKEPGTVLKPSFTFVYLIYKRFMSSDMKIMIIISFFR